MRPVNILVTGTPGCGKSTFCGRLAACSGLKHVEVGEVVRRHRCHTGRNEKFDCYVLDDDKVDPMRGQRLVKFIDHGFVQLIDVLEPVLKNGGNIVDFHTSYVFPERCVDLVVVLRTNNTLLYERLENRKYSPVKIRENIEAEIMQVCLDEAHDNFDEEIVMELQNDNLEQLDDNVKTIAAWMLAHPCK